MHQSALNHAGMFFNAYATRENLQIAELGSQDIQGSMRSIKPVTSTYVGYDFVEGTGVDVVLTDKIKLPVEDNTYDIVVSSSCFEHAPLFWLNFLEVMRILKPSGLFYMQAPSNGAFHRYPVDCWRFFPDSGHALADWGKMSDYPKCEMLESFTGDPDNDIWKDFVAVFIKDISYVDLYPTRIVDTHQSYTNGMKFGQPIISNLDWWENK